MSRTLISPSNLPLFEQAVEANAGRPVVIDVETTGVDPWPLGTKPADRIIGIAVFLSSTKTSWYIPTRHNPRACFEPYWYAAEKQPTARKQKFPPNQRRRADGAVEELARWEDYRDRNCDDCGDRLTRARVFGDILGDPNQVVINHNLKFDFHMFEGEGFDIRCQWFDTMPIAHLLDENCNAYTLEYLGQLYCGEGKATDELAEWAKAHKIHNPKECLADCPLTLVARYAMGDVELTWKLANRLQRHLKEQGLAHLVPEINVYNRVIAGMESRGVYIDRDRAGEQIVSAEVRTETLRQEMVRIAGREFLPSSPAQVSDLLYRPRVAPPDVKLPHCSVDKVHLMRIAEDDQNAKAPIAKAILEYRQWDKALTTYYRPWLERCDNEGRLHPSLLLHGTISGRLSCRSPNLQNIPRASDIYDVRSVVVAPPGRVLVSCDISQIELRIAAHYTEDPVMLEVYRQGGDIHQMTSDRLGLTKALGSEEGRQRAKTVNFRLALRNGR
jgi:DNA polymerase-1